MMMGEYVRIVDGADSVEQEPMKSLQMGQIPLGRNSLFPVRVLMEHATLHTPSFYECIGLVRFLTKH